MEDGLGFGFYLKLTGVVLAFGIGGFILMLIFTRAVYAWGLIGAFIALSAVMLAIAWVYDRRQAKRYDELESE
jgi:uncharacterized membrane protein